MNSILNIVCIGIPKDYFQFISKNENISIITIENSIQATNYLNSNKPADAIICNYNLAGNNGLFMFDWIREQAQYNAIPFLLLAKEFNVDIYKLAFKK
jgi:response regulator RpfG family c-di-GMP phosphodiesterase